MTSILAVSDLHVGSTVAVCQKQVELDDGGTYQASPGQRWLFDRWLDMVEKVKQYQPTLILNGDLAEGDFKGRTYQLITRNKATVKRITAELLDPLLKVCGSRYVIRGTPAHAGKSAHMEESIADDIDATGPNPKINSWYYLPAKIDRVRIDVAHHTNAGGMPFTAASAADRTARRVIEGYIQSGEAVPDLILRSHVHVWSDSYDHYPVRAIHLSGSP